MPSQSMVIVRLKYHSSEITVPVTDCHYSQESLENFESIPSELEGLLLLAKSVLLSDDSKSIAWRIMDSEDKKERNNDNIESIMLGRNSYFHQIRNLVWDLESSLLSGSSSTTVKHPKSGQQIDLQAAYSESQIDWVFARFGKLANMTELENIAVNGEKVPEPEKNEPNKQIPDDNLEVVPPLDLTAIAEETTNIVSSQPPQEPKSSRPRTDKQVVKAEYVEPVVKQESARAEPVVKQESARARPESPRNKAEAPRNKAESPRNNEKGGSIEASNSKPSSSQASARKEDSINYENSGFEDYGDDFDEPEDEKNTIAKDTLNDRYAALLNANEDDNDDDIDYDNL